MLELLGIKHAPMGEQAKQELLAKMKTGLIDMAWGDISKASAGGSKMGAFILCSCYIDYLAGFRFGRETTRKDYKHFIEMYLKSYDPDKMYHDMRCGIVHNYSEGGSYAFVYSLADLHLYRPGGFGKITLNLENFMTDIENATKNYFEELEGSEVLLTLAAKRMAQISILQAQDHL